MYYDYSLGMIRHYVAELGNLTEEQGSGIIPSREIEPYLDCSIDLLYRFDDTQQPALAFQRLGQSDIYTLYFVNERIELEWMEVEEPK